MFRLIMAFFALLFICAALAALIATAIAWLLGLGPWR